MMMKVADFLGDSVSTRQQQEPWRWTLRGFLPVLTLNMP